MKSIITMMQGKLIDRSANGPVGEMKHSRVTNQPIKSCSDMCTQESPRKHIEHCHFTSCMPHSSLVVLGPGKTRTHCGGNIVSCDVARSWQNEATLLRDARTQEKFLEIFRNIFCVQDTKFVSATNVARVAKRVNIWEP